MTKDRKWLSVGKACKIAELSEGQVRSLIDRGLVTVRRLPGLPTQVLAADIERLAESFITPAKDGELARLSA
jgi:hypothetical protein